MYDNVAPNAPANLAAPSPTRLPVLTWGAVTDTAGIARYDVYRDGVLAGSSASTTFTDNGVPADGPYTYTVRGIDNAGNIGAVSPSKLGRGRRGGPADADQPHGAVAPGTKPSLAWTTGGADNSSGLQALPGLPQRRGPRDDDGLGLRQDACRPSTAPSSTRWRPSTTPATSRPRPAR